MADFLRKYGEQTSIEFPLFAPGGEEPESGLSLSTSDVTICAGSGTSFASVTNAPTEIGSTGWYRLTLTASEMQADRIAVNIQDADGAAFEWCAFAIETYGNGSAQHAFDLDSSTVTLGDGAHGGTSATLVLSSVTVHAETGPAVDLTADSGACVSIDASDQADGVSVVLNDGASSEEWDLISGSDVQRDAIVSGILNKTISTTSHTSTSSVARLLHAAAYALVGKRTANADTEVETIYEGTTTNVVATLTYSDDGTTVTRTPS